MPTTPTSTPSSSASAPPPADGPGAARIHWRPSRYVTRTLLAFGPLGALSLLVSDLPLALGWPAAALVLVLAWRAARREASRPHRAVAITPDGCVLLDGRPLPGARLQWRGPLAFLQWREGRRLRALSWWPDTLPPDARRELRLAGPVAP